MKIEGTLVVIEDQVQVKKDFRKRGFILAYNDRGHDEFISFEMFQSQGDQLDSFHVGDKVSVEFGLKGRKWTNGEGHDKYFNTLQAWKVEAIR